MDQNLKKKNIKREIRSESGCGQGFIHWGKSKKPGHMAISFSPKRCESLSRTGTLVLRI